MKKASVLMEEAVAEKTKSLTSEERLKGREAILAVLARAADGSQFLTQPAANPTEALRGYYTLTQEEMAALVSGDIKKIEGWLGKLDKQHAIWLWSRLNHYESGSLPD